jgi:hypothetical protein
MKPLNLDEVREYVNANIADFHERRKKTLEDRKLHSLLTKNPYLFRAKNVLTAGELITGLLDASLSSSEEELFGGFLEGLAVFIAQQTCNGHKSTAQGVWSSSTRAFTTWSLSNPAQNGATVLNMAS